MPVIIEALHRWAWNGVTCVRNGYPVNPSIATALPAAARQFAAAGLSIPLVTAGDFNRPDIEYAERYAACGEAGVKHVKLGHWHWQPGMRYWAEVDKLAAIWTSFRRSRPALACRPWSTTTPGCPWAAFAGSHESGQGL
ncbi:MAG: hypothetical protein R2911_40140 [Caldilineaceae bacterium]